MPFISGILIQAYLGVSINGGSLSSLVALWWIWETNGWFRSALIFWKPSNQVMSCRVPLRQMSGSKFWTGFWRVWGYAILDPHKFSFNNKMGIISLFFGSYSKTSEGYLQESDGDGWKIEGSLNLMFSADAPPACKYCDFFHPSICILIFTLNIAVIQPYFGDSLDNLSFLLMFESLTFFTGTWPAGSSRTEWAHGKTIALHGEFPLLQLNSP